MLSPLRGGYVVDLAGSHTHAPRLCNAFEVRALLSVQRGHAVL